MTRGVCIQWGLHLEGLGRPPPPPRYMGYYRIWSTNGWYASYWNAFLFMKKSNLSQIEKQHWQICQIFEHRQISCYLRNDRLCTNSLPWIQFIELKAIIFRRGHFRTVEFFLNGPQLSLNSGNLINHWSINWAQFKDPPCYPYFVGTAVASWSLTQEVAGSNSLFKNIIFLSLNSLNSVKTFGENSITILFQRSRGYYEKVDTFFSLRLRFMV